jgi:hypothetical protein
VNGPTKIGGIKVYPYANEYPLMRDYDPEGWARLVRSIKSEGLREQIEVVHDGDGKEYIIIDGRNRALALVELRFNLSLSLSLKPDKPRSHKFFKILPTVDYPDGTLDDAKVRAHIDIKNYHRRHLTQEWKEKVLARIIERNADKSSAVIADEAKKEGIEVTDRTIRRKVALTRTPVRVEKTKGKDGRKRKLPVPKAKKPDPISSHKSVPSTAEPIHRFQWWKLSLDVIAEQMANNFTEKEIASLCAKACDLRKAKASVRANGKAAHSQQQLSAT